MEKLARLLLPSFLLAAIFVALAAVEPFSGPNPATDSFLFEADVEASADGPAYLFYDRGAGFRASDAASAIVKKATRQTCRFLVPPGLHRALRLEAQSPGKVTVFAARFVDLQGHEVARFTPADFRAAQPQDQVEQRDGGVHFRTGVRSGAALAFAQPLALQPRIDLPQALTQLVLITALLALVLWKFEAFFVARRQQLATALQPLVERARAHPIRVLLTVAAIAVVVSCHPVIFFGKSFVSPNNRAPCLYEDFPTLPGAPAGPIEDPKYSDLGAMMWQNLPYSMIEHRAIFRDHELPLWNRDNSCGVPLLGQGLSMLGDPLHWIAILADGAPWAWDTKFVLAKIVFAFGIGMLVFSAVGRLGVAVLLAASCAFIGFFSYRLNHPAFFSLSYSPWILFAWIGLMRTANWRAAAPWAALLIGANWIELNSGTAKETAILIAGLNFTGVLVIFCMAESAAGRLRKLAIGALSLALFLLLSAPLWIVFLDALRHAHTSYNAPRAYQIQPSLLIGLFDDLFYRQTIADERHTNPSANFLLLLGAVWAVVAARRLMANRVFLGCALGSVPAFLLAFGVVPPRFIVQLPFLGNVSHIDNTFSCVLLVLLFPLAGFGLEACRERMNKRIWRGDWIVTLLVAGVLLAAFFGYIQTVTRSGFALIHESGNVPKSAFFIGYATALLIAFAVLPLAARSLIRGRAGALANVLLIALSLFAMHFRQGMYLETKFDPYVMNPQDRIDLSAPSPAVEYVKAHLPEPARVTGFEGVLTPGFNVVLGLETISGPDALTNLYYRQFLEASKIEVVWDCRAYVSKASALVLRPFYDLLGVRYYLGTPGEGSQSVPGLKLVGSRDLDVYESTAIWPRAFFTDALARYDEASDLAKMVWESDHRPLAAIQKSEVVKTSLPAELPARRIVPASGYALTANGTSFMIDAPAAGVVVVGEAFEDGNFRATVNGAPTQTFRVNHAFNGVLLPAAGHYAVQLKYWPHLLTPALWLSAIGAILLLGLAGWFWRVGAGRPV